MVGQLGFVAHSGQVEVLGNEGHSICVGLLEHSGHVGQLG